MGVQRSTSGVAGPGLATGIHPGLSTMVIRHAAGNYEPDPPDERTRQLGEALVASGTTAATSALFEQFWRTLALGHADER